MPDRIVYLEDVTQLAGDGVTDDTMAFYSAIMGASSGDWIKGKKGAEYRLASVGSLAEAGIPLNKVKLDLNGATASFEQTSSMAYGFRMLNDGWLWGEGRARTTISQNASPQRIAHSPVTVGCGYGCDGPIGAPNPYVSTRGWKIGGGIKVETVKPDGSLIGCHGEFEDYFIEDVYFPDSAYAGLGIAMDWLPRGLVVPEDTPTSLRTKFNNGTFYTLHPGAGEINRIHAGLMSYTGNAAQDDGFALVRLSAAHHTSVKKISAKRATSLFKNVGGDFGFEFAPAGMKPNAGKGIHVSGGRLENQVGVSGIYNAIYADSLADNILADVQLHGYEPLMDPIGNSGIIIENIFSRTATALNSGFRVRSIRDAKLINCSSFGNLHSVSIEDAAYKVEVIGGVHESTSSHGIFIDGTSQPEDCVIRGALCSLNVGAGIYADRAKRPILIENTIGRQNVTETATWGLRATDDCTGYRIQNNRIFGCTGPAVSCGSTETVGVGGVISDNYVAPGLVRYGGSAIVLVMETVLPGLNGRLFFAQYGSVTASGPVNGSGNFQTGDLIFVMNAPSGPKQLLKSGASWVVLS